ncbi:MAG: helix-turn-helix domain-containing protein [Actinomycetota bacterium]|nr:helix-turn-helix domain-containing protein [Actinomycetota bacterium]
MPRRRMTLEEAFGEAVREARGKKQLSQDALAHEAGRHRTYLSDVERGLSSPSLKTIALLADVLDTTASALVERAEQILAGGGTRHR